MAEETTARFACNACGKSYRWKPELAGRKVKCTCGHVMVAPAQIGGEQLIPLADEPASAQTVQGHQIMAATGAGMPAIGDVAPPPAAGKTASAGAKPASKPSPKPRGASQNGRCPACNAKLASGAVVCVDCGMNLQTGRRLATTDQIARAAQASGVILQRNHSAPENPGGKRWLLPVVIGSIVLIGAIAATIILMRGP